MRTFDVFDTLITRKCVQPQGIFALVEQRSGIADFAVRRVAAEQRLLAQDYTFADIYRELAADLALDAATSAQLQQIELDTELQNVMPIAENLRAVEDGDLLLTDMYLPTEFIERLLRHAGLRKRVVIHRSSGGKSSGRVWRTLQLLDQGGAVGGIQHLGDHPRDDGALAGAHGIATRLTAAAALTPVENFLLANGFTGTALIARALRLEQAGDDPVGLELNRLQAGFNIPVLLLASLYLRSQIQTTAEPPANLLFCSRDCRAWADLYAALGGMLDRAAGGAATPGSPAVHYFYTSRLARTQGSTAYLDYFRSLVAARSLIVDLCGTGLSLARLNERAGTQARCFFLYRIANDEIIRTVRHAYAGEVAVEATAILEAQQGTDFSQWEMLNYAPHGMVLDVANIETTYFPLCAAPEFSAVQLGWIRAMQGVVARAVELLGDPLLAHQLVQFDAQVPAPVIAATIAQLWREVERSPVLSLAFARTHEMANAEVTRRLVVCR